MNWKQSLHSEVNHTYLSNPNPAVGDFVKVRMKVWKDAPLNSVDLRVVISGNPERLPMIKSHQGALFAWWETSLPVEHKEMIYWHFLLHTPDGELFFNRAGVQTINPTEDHDWTLIPSFDGPEWIKGAVFYQIFPDRFCNGDPKVGHHVNEYEFDGASPRIMQWTDEPIEFEEGRCLDFFNGDLAGVQEKLDYLKGLGVTALYLTPIFSAKTTHRYDCTDYFQVDDALGGDEALANLTEAARAKGIKIVVDVSINHTGSDHVWHKKALEDPDSKETKFYYSNGEGGFQGWNGVPTLPQLNYSRQEVRDVIWQGDDALVKHWLRKPWYIDGWRFDVGSATGRRGKDQLGHDIWRGVRIAIKGENPEAYIVGEHWEDAIAYQLGDQWDGVMNYFACGSPLRRWLGERVRFESDGREYPPEKGRPFTGFELEQMIRQNMDRLPSQLVPLQMNVMDTHDIHRVHHSPAFDWDVYRGAVMLQFLLPGAPNLWYGDEVGLKGHTRSVEGCRYPMEWRKENWDHRFMELYRTLARLKRDEPVLNDGGYKFLGAGECWLSFARFDNHKAIIALLNRNSELSTVTIPINVLGLGIMARDLFDGREFRVSDGVLGLDLKPCENLLLELFLTD